MKVAHLNLIFICHSLIELFAINLLWKQNNFLEINVQLELLRKLNEINVCIINKLDDQNLITQKLTEFEKEHNEILRMFSKNTNNFQEKFLDALSQCKIKLNNKLFDCCWYCFRI